MNRRQIETNVTEIDQSPLPPLHIALMSEAPTRVKRVDPTWTPTSSSSSSPSMRASTDRIRRYASLPYRMRARPAGPGALRCFTSPYWSGSSPQQRALAVESFASAVRYPPGPLAESRARQCRALKELQAAKHADHCALNAMCAAATARPMRYYPASAPPRSLVSTLEIGYDLLAMQPHAYALSLAGRLQSVTSVPMSSAFYFFAPDPVCEDP